MEESQNELKASGRPKTPVLDRIQGFLKERITGEISDLKKDQHWIWQGKTKPPTTRRRYNKHTKSFAENTAFIMPCRIRDEDGQLRSVARILFRELRGVDYPYPPRRTHGCDYRCVNPFHLALPEGLDEMEPPTLDISDDIDGLVDEIGNFIAANGRDDAAIMSRFLIDYSESEINQALARLT